MSAILGALGPVFLIILVGWAARAAGLVPKADWAGVNRLAYWVFFPALLFTTIARADFSAIAAGPFLAATVAGFLTMACLAMALRVVLRRTSGPAFTSIFQGAVRWNGIILLAVAEPLFGPQGAALAALVFAPAVPLVNIASVGVLSIWGDGASPSPGRFFGRLVTNPLIVASLAGGILNVAGLRVLDPPAMAVIANALDLLAAAALAGGLLGVGAGLDLRSLATAPRLLGLAVVLKLVVMPGVMAGYAILFQLEPLAGAVLVAAGATPGAAASYVLARELGGDAPLTAGHVTATTLVSALTLPLWMALVAPVG